MTLLYNELSGWYRMLTPVEEYAEEAEVYRGTFEAALAGSAAPRTLLELGCGAGHNAFYLKAAFRCTLTDLSPDMLALSRALNPECEHAEGDMRALRLGRTFDAVFVHDAVTYMLTEDDLRAAAATAFVHTRPGGVAIFQADVVKETFEEDTEYISGADGDRAMRCTMWSWDPDPDDTTCCTEFGFLLRENGEVRAVLDRHVEGLFPEAAWERVLAEAGFVVTPRQQPPTGGEMFVCRRPG
ncbi:MAG: class I SAM-dependent methyltransferase [Deltaproteobacteria bacterium]|nr:class I SAM-dependent methyltransferase [Myxococcales bacterium]MDP3212796.1 class I SAM-dependent methyltransferase [Deltaproteobacteria bacterium]